MIKAVIFDIDGVLMDSFPANLKFFQDLMVKNGYTPPTAEEYKLIFYYDMLSAIKALINSNNETEVKKIWEMGRNREVLYDISLATTPANMPETVKELSQIYKLGLVTSRVRETTFADLTLAKLREYFGVVISYQDTTNHKPHPEPLLLAASKLEVKPAKCVYIGDVENDIICARAAGMKVIIYAPSLRGQSDRQKQSNENFPNADATFSNFKELPEVVKSL